MRSRPEAAKAGALRFFVDLIISIFIFTKDILLEGKEASDFGPTDLVKVAFNEAEISMSDGREKGEIPAR